jgi:subtilisin family serine protease
VAAALAFAFPPLVRAQPSGVPGGAPRVVTLITGDEVLVSGTNTEAVRVRRAAGREQIRFVTHHIRVAAAAAPHVFVIPSDAAPLIAAGRVDRRLFDVTLLLDYQYDDAHRDSLPLIVTYERNRAAAAVPTPRAVPGATAGRQLPAVNGMSVISPKSRLVDVWGAVSSSRSGATARAAVSEPIGKIWLDGLLRPLLEQSVAQIGAPTAWALGYEGDGVLVGVLDTGVDVTHLDLVDRLIASRNFTLEGDEDQVGHGTHVASIIAGSGAADAGRRRGVAPGALLLAGKVCEGLYCLESSVIAGMHWAVAEEGARVVNISLSGSDAPGFDPLEEAVSTLTAQYGALFVLAAGNEGPLAGSIGSPSANAAALTVGAVDRDGQVAIFSSRGMTLDGAIKPDLTAPGVDIVAARAAGTEPGVLVGDDYVALSGTSMAAPHVAGAAALLLDRHPSWGPAELKSVLIGSASYNPKFSVLDQGAGQVDVAAALDVTLVASAPSLSFGVARWPHEDDEPLLRKLTYRNLGPATELAIQVDVLGPDAAPAPEGMFSVEPAVLVLPEGGSATVTVRADTRVNGADGVYGGRLIATDAAGPTVAVPLAVEREGESYDLVLRYIDRQGQPAASHETLLVGFEPNVYEYFGPPPGQQDRILRLPKNQYMLETFINDPSGSDTFTLLVTPNLDLVADTLLEFDARAATPVNVTIPNPHAEPISASLNYEAGVANGLLRSGIGMELRNPIYYGGVVGPPAQSMTASLQTVWQDSSSSPVSAYSAGWTEEGRLPTGDFAVDMDQLGVVHAHYAAPLGTQLPFSDVYTGVYVPGTNSYGSPAIRVELPHERLEYYYAGTNTLLWVNGFWSRDEAGLQNFLLDGAPTQYLAGRSYTSRWNQPMFGAVVPVIDILFRWASRAGDLLRIGPPMYGDAAGHAGYVTNESRIRLYRDGALLAESTLDEGGYFDVPPEPATYRVELDTSQSLFELTTQQRLVWTFESAQAPEDEFVRPPVLTVHFQPSLDPSGRAPRGRFCLPLRLTVYGGGTPADESPPGVEVSYDDGATWVAAAVEENGSVYEADLVHPDAADYVSLRGSIVDSSGNTVEHTIIRAYGLRAR